MRKSTLIFSLFAASVVGCGSSGASSTGGEGGTSSAQSAVIAGHVANGTGSDAVAFGGPSAVQSSVTVSALTIDASGTATSIAQGPVSSDGTYTLDVPVHSGPTLVETLDAKGAVVARAILEDALVVGKTVMVQPITTESSVEAAVLLEMTQTGAMLADIDLVALRARIDATTAMVVQADAVAQASQAKTDVEALAVATLAAQMSQQASLAAANVSATTYAAGELAAADALTAALNVNGAAAAPADAAFTAALAALDTQVGLDAAAVASLETNAAASAQSAIAAVSTSMALTNAFDHAQAMIESAASAAAMVEAFTKATAPATVMTDLQTANAALISQVSAATDTATLATAFETWRTAVRGTTAGTGGLLATVLGATIIATPAYLTTVGSIMALDAPLQTALGASAAASENTAGAVDASTLAGLVAKAYATFGAGVQAAVTSSTTTFVAGESALTSSVFVSSQASF
jgi:hypothetical protein